MSYSLHFKNILKLISDNTIVNVIDSSSFHKYFLEEIFKNYKCEYIPMDINLEYTNQLNSNFLINEDTELLIIEDIYSYKSNVILIQYKGKVLLYTKSDPQLVHSSQKYNFKEKDKLYSDLYTNRNRFSTLEIYTEENMLDKIKELYYSDVKGDFLIFQHSSELEKILNLSNHLIKNKNTNETDRKIIFGNDTEWYDNIAFVFDDLKTLNLTSTVTGSERIEKTFISKYIAECRKNNSECIYRFISEEEYDKLNIYPESEIKTRALHEILLNLFDYVGDKQKEKLHITQKTFIQNFLETLDGDSKERADDLYNNFWKFNIVKYNNINKGINNRIVITQRGELLRLLPFGFRNSLLIVLAIENNVAVQECILIASLLENYTRLNLTLPFNFLKESDLSTLFNLYVLYSNGVNISKYINDENTKNNKDITNLTIYLENVRMDIELIENIIDNLKIGEYKRDVLEYDKILQTDYIEIVYWDRKLNILPEYDLYPKYISKDLENYEISEESLSTVTSKFPETIWNLVWTTSYIKEVVVCYISKNVKNLTDNLSDNIEDNESY